MVIEGLFDAGGKCNLIADFSAEIGVSADGTTDPETNSDNSIDNSTETTEQVGLGDVDS